MLSGYFLLLLFTSGSAVTPQDEITGSMVLVQQNNNIFEGSFSFQAITPIVGWEMTITFTSPVQNLRTWDANFLQKPGPGCSTKFTLVNKERTGTAMAGDKTSVRVLAQTCGGGSPPGGSYTLKDLSLDHQTLPSVPSIPGAQQSKYNYAEVLMKSILFYEAQRSGKLPSNNRIPWRGDSALNDKGHNGEDLTGGWYDAGDNVKFNYPIAFSTTILSWGLLTWKDAYTKAGQLQAMYDSIKWSLDYFIKCHTKPNELYVQVGDGAQDHATWTSPERMYKFRPAFKIDAQHPGSDVAMETVAAMAAGAMVFKDKGDTTYANQLLTHAKQLFQFAKTYQGIYTDSVKAAEKFYKSAHYKDENSWGAIWLYKATGDSSYLQYAEDNYINTTTWGFSWDEKMAGANLLLYIETKDAKYKQTVTDTFKDWFPGGSVPYTPKCLAFRLQWGALRYAANTAFLALVAADNGINPTLNRKWAMTQIHYALGDTGRSFVVGFGTKYPLSPLHRGSSCPMMPAPCGETQRVMPEPNPHTLYGALVGGPGIKDDYEDVRTDNIHNEESCDYNAGFQGAIAGLLHLALTNQLPATYTDICP